MALLTEIKSSNWQVGLQGSGNVVQGLEDIRQCIDVLLRTQKGTDPLRPEFGSDIYQQIDKPVNFVIPFVKQAIITAVQLFEQRVEIVSITHIIDVSHVSFFITYSLVDSDVEDQVQLFLTSGGYITTPALPAALIIEAPIPATYQQLVVDFTINGAAALPMPPEFGFVSPAEMYSWIIANWGFYGSWYLLPDKLVLFLNPGATTATLTITSVALHKYTAVIPNVFAGRQYMVAVTDSVIGNYAGGPYNTVAELLSDLIINESVYGSWVIESSIGPGDFDPADFESPDFLTTAANYFLCLYTYNAETVGITVTST